MSVVRQSMNIIFAEKERRGVDLLSKTHPRTVFLEISPDIGSFGYWNRFNARSLVLRGYRTALRVLTEAKERGVFNAVLAKGAALN